MKLKLLLSLFMVFCLAGCGNGTNSDGIIADVPGEDKEVPTISESFAYEDYNSSDFEYDTYKWYINDLVSVNLPDPYVLEQDDVYYIYGTTDRNGGKTVDCYSTVDFNNFEEHRDVFIRDNTHWSGTGYGIFAPEVMKFGDVYYMYYSAQVNSSGRRYIDVAVSDSPIGPFKPYVGVNADGIALNSHDAPVFRHNDTIDLDVLDQTIFVDGDKMYMYYSVYDTSNSQYIVGMEMKDPVTIDYSTYKILIRPGEETAKQTLGNKKYFWEAFKSFEVAEGPFMIKSPNGKYYLTYSVNHYPDKYYSVCYAVADSPLGDYTKPYTDEQVWTNLLFGYAGGMENTTVYKQWDGFMSGTGHHCFFNIGEQIMIGYHAHNNRTGNSRRYFAMDKVFFDKDGVPFCQGPSATIQYLPESISGYKNIAVDSKVYASPNILNAERINDNYVAEHYNLIQDASREVTLPVGKSYIELEFDREYTIGGIQIINSCDFNKCIKRVEYINFFNGNAIMEAYVNEEHIKVEKDFIFPDSGITFNLDDIKASKVVICFDNSLEASINEIIVLGY